RSGEAIRTFTVKEGLKSPYIFTINKDPKGVYWFGTNNGGVSRYDGAEWKTYLPSDGLADFWVYGIDFAADGAVWIATWDGVSRFDGKNFKNYNTKDGLADRWVYALAIDEDGAVWFGTEAGVSRLDKKGKWKNWRHQDGLGAPNKLALPKSDNTGFGTLSRSEDEDYNHKHNLSVLGPEGNETYNENYVFSMAIDHDGNKWFGTWGGGVSRFDGVEWQSYTTKDGLAGNIVFAITVDPSDGAVWFGTNHGASRFDGRNWTSLTLEDGLADENVYAIAIDADQRVWLGEKGGVDVWAPIKKRGEAGG
ncbi:MAG: two-component regulator propeller domain-containing protein, partial [Nitrospiria bacterium]